MKLETGDEIRITYFAKKHNKPLLEKVNGLNNVKSG